MTEISVEKELAEAPPVKPGFFSLENLRSLGGLLLIVFAVRWSVASPYHVPTASMEPTIKVGDRLLAFKLAYNLKVPFTDWVLAEWGSPQRGDIIVFKFPKNPDIDYVKRVIGVPGDRIEVLDDIIHINGKPQGKVPKEESRAVLDDIQDRKEHKELFLETLEEREHWTLQNKSGYRPFTQNGFGPITVEEGSLFVMGDNRDNSNDSRVWGFVPMSYVRGKAEFVIWSVFSSATGEGWPTLRFDRFGKNLYSL